jgi:hypothetical protein
MAIYVKAKMIEETQEFVIYAYGGSPDNLMVYSLQKKIYLIGR